MLHKLISDSDFVREMIYAYYKEYNDLNTVFKKLFLFPINTYLLEYKQLDYDSM